MPSLISNNYIYFYYNYYSIKHDLIISAHISPKYHDFYLNGYSSLTSCLDLNNRR